MAYSLTIAGYTFDNPPRTYRKNLSLGNTPVPHHNRDLAQYYWSDQQELQFEVQGRLSLNEQADLDELDELQQIAIEGGEVDVDFDPFFSGKCVIEDDPFRQADELSSYRFILTVNEDTTDTSAYPSHATPTTGNRFTLGSFDFGYDPDSVEENYERQTSTTDRLQGVSQSVDTAGLVTKVSIDGHTDGGGVAALWDKARNNELSKLSAEFQKGWALIDNLSIENDPRAPDYLTGLFQYSMDLFVVKNPELGIGTVSSFIDHDVRDTGTYTSDSDSGDSDFSGLEFTVSTGSGAINDSYVNWNETTLTLSDDATNWVYVTDDDGDGQGDVEYNNSGFPADGIKLYRVYTSNGDIDRIEDVRSRLINDNDADAGDSDSRTKDGEIYYTVAGGTSPDDPNDQQTTWVQTTHKLAVNATNYLFVEDPDTDGDGQVAINQSGYPADTVSLWRVETDSDSITNEIDDRPADLESDGSGDSSNSDLVLSDDFVIDDTGFDYNRLLTFSDTFSVADSILFAFVYSFTDSLTLSDGPITPFLVLTSLTETVTIEDGGGTGAETAVTTSATIPTDTSITLTVYEDTDGDGTVDNQQDITVGDGTNDYALDGLRGGDSTYWVEPSLTTSDTSTTPELDSVTITAGQAGDADQNKNTNWTIFGGQYDTSGNEYEGGGVTTKYKK